MVKAILWNKRIVSICLTFSILAISIAFSNIYNVKAANTYDDNNPALDFKVISEGKYYNGELGTGTLIPQAGTAPSDGKYIIRTNSYVTWYTNDDIALAYKKYDIGDSTNDNLTVETTVMSHVSDTDGISTLHDNASAGIMMRDSLDSDAANVFVHARKNNVMIVYRMAKGQEMKAETAPFEPIYPLKLKLVRKGKVFTGYYMGPNDKDWRKVATVAAVFNGPTYAGLCSHSCEKEVFVKSTYQGFTAVGSGTYSGVSGETPSGDSSQGSTSSEQPSEEQLPGTPPIDEPFNPSEQPNVLLYENFSDGSRVKGPESVANPIWKNPSGELAELKSGNRVWYKNYVDTFDFIGNKEWSDYSVSVDIAYSEFENFQMDSKFAIYTRHREYVMYGVSDYATVFETYTYNINGAIQYDEAKNPIRKLRAYIAKRDRFNLSNNISLKPVTDYYCIDEDWQKEGNFHNITIDNFDNRIALRIDGTEVLEYIDNDVVVNSFGSIGFETINSSMYFDNIKVTKLEDDLGGDYDNYVCGLWDQPVPDYIEGQGIPYYSFSSSGEDIWAGFDDRK